MGRTPLTSSQGGALIVVKLKIRNKKHRKFWEQNIPKHSEAVMDQHEILETLKSSFLFNFRTGNVMIDTMITGFIIMVSTYLFNAGNKVFNSLDPFSWYGSWISVKRRSKIKIAGKKLQGADSTRLHYSTNFFAVLYQIKKLNCVKADIKELSEIPVEEPDGVSYDYDSDYSDYDDDCGDKNDREKTS